MDLSLRLCQNNPGLHHAFQFLEVSHPCYSMHKHSWGLSLKPSSRISTAIVPSEQRLYKPPITDSAIVSSPRSNIASNVKRRYCFLSNSIPSFFSLYNIDNHCSSHRVWIVFHIPSENNMTVAVTLINLYLVLLIKELYFVYCYLY